MEEADIPVLLSMGKEHLFVWELGRDQLHENDAAYRMAALCHGENCVVSKEPHEGKPPLPQQLRCFESIPAS